MPLPDPGDAAAQIIGDHPNAGAGACGCGWDDPGGWAAHVVHMLRMAGLDFTWR